MTYYKGKIAKISELEEDCTIISKYYGASKISNEMIDHGDIDKMLKLMKENKGKLILNGPLFDLIKQYKQYKVKFVNSEIPIIYEQITDKSGKKFGKELISV